MSDYYPDSLFKSLPKEEVKEYEEWADENQTKEHWEKRNIYHPTVRNRWESNGFADKMRKEN